MIIKYEQKYFNDVYRLVKACWENEFKMSEKLRKFIYDFLVRYYLYEDGYNYLLIEDGKVMGFLFANKKNAKNDSMTFFKAELNCLDAMEQKQAIDYLKYIENNHHMVLEQMQDDQIYLALLLSNYKGGGAMLINELKKNIKGKAIYLWTDETCNYKYYEKHHFKLCKEYVVKAYNKSLKTFIYAFE